MAVTHSGLMGDPAETSMALAEKCMALAKKCMAGVEKHVRSGSPPYDPTRTPCEGHLRPHIDRLRSRGATKRGPPLEYPLGQDGLVAVRIPTSNGWRGSNSVSVWLK